MFNNGLPAGSPMAGMCTGISLATTAGEHVHGRTIEWGHFDLGSKLIVSPRGRVFTSGLPMDRAGLTWESRYGFVGISVSEDRFIGEGMNEAGLNAGLFYFAGYGSLAPFDPDDTANSIADMDLVRWLLSRFASVEEVRAEFDTITVAPIFIENGEPSPTAHWRVTDRNGGSIVIEITDHGKVDIYDNTVGALTNSPGFPWMVTNLNTYINVHPGTVAPREVDGVQLRSFGTGTASLGLPGDMSPPSRFVRAFFYRSTAPPLGSTEAAVSQAFTILHNFDLPIGIEFAESERSHIPDIPSATQWTAVSDLSDGAFYYSTMYDAAIKRVDLKKIDFSGENDTAHALDSGSFTVLDVTP